MGGSKASSRPVRRAAAARTRGFVVTAKGDRPIEEVARGLRDAGFKVDAVLGAIGSITGSAPSAAAATLRKIPGVAAVEPDAPVDVGPPDSDETW